MLHNTHRSPMRRSLELSLGICFLLVLTSCDALHEPYQQQGWATTRITSDFCADVTTQDSKMPTFNRCVFPTRDEAGNVVPEGEVVTASALNHGREAYMHYCYACHGVEGDGKGPAAFGLRPPPRDFRIHSYKFAAVKEGLPNDGDFMRIVKGGLHGSAMLEWDVPDSQLALIIDFIKTFPPPPCDAGTPPTEEGTAKCAKQAEEFPNGMPNAWQERFVKDAALFASNKASRAKGPGVPIVVPEVDPWAGKIEEALQAGKELYHLRAQCVNCHAAYITKQEFATLLKTDNPSFRDDMYFSKPILAKDNLYKVNIMPPDFAMNPVKSIRLRERDVNGDWVQLDQVRELWRLIASGIGGTGMPSWKDSISDDEIWALAHYVKSIMDLRLPENRGALKAMQDTLTKQSFQPKVAPAPAPEPAAPASEGDETDAAEKAGDAKEGEDVKATPSAAPEAAPAPKDAPKPAAPKPAAPKPAAPKPAAPKPAPKAPADTPYD